MSVPAGNVAAAAVAMLEPMEDEAMTAPGPMGCSGYPLLDLEEAGYN